MKVKNRVFQSKNVVVLMSFFLAIMLAFAPLMLSKRGVSSGRTKVDSKTFYAVFVGSFSTFSEAETYASSLKLRGGAGVVKNDGVFSVYLALYEKKKEAESVTKKLQAEGIQANSEKLSTGSLVLSKAQAEIERTFEALFRAMELLNSAVGAYATDQADLDATGAVVLGIHGEFERARRIVLAEDNDSNGTLLALLAQAEACFSDVFSVREEGLVLSRLRAVEFDLFFLAKAGIEQLSEE